LGEAAAPPGVVENVDALRQRVVNAFNGAGRRAGAVGGEELECHELDVPGDPGNADAIVADGSDGAGHEGAVVVVVHGIAAVVDGADAMDIVDVPVIVIVEPVIGDFTGIDPHIGGEIGMVVVHTAIYNAYDNRICIGAEGPGFGGIDVGVGAAAVLPGVVEAPELTEGRIVRKGLGLVNGEFVIGFGELNEGVGSKEGDGLFDVEAFWEADDLDIADAGKGAANGGALGVVEGLELGAGGAQAGLD
jgi:hypothetical protein